MFAAVSAAGGSAVTAHLRLVFAIATWWQRAVLGCEPLCELHQRLELRSQDRFADEDRSVWFDVKVDLLEQGLVGELSTLDHIVGRARRAVCGISVSRAVL